LDARIESRCNAKRKGLLLNIAKHGTANPDFEMPYPELQEIGHKELISYLTTVKEEEIAQNRTRIMKLAESTGSVHLVENYQKHLFLLTHPLKHNANFIGPFTNLVTRFKLLEQRILGLQVDSLGSKYLSSSGEFGYIVGLVEELSFSKSTLDEISKQVAVVDAIKLEKCKLIQDKCMKMMNSFYKFIINLMKIKRAEKNMDS